MRNFFSRLAYSFQRFMYGRNGIDQLGYFTLVLYFILAVITALLKVNQNIIVRIVQLLLLIVYLFRLFSRNLSKRRNENQKFLAVYNPIRSGIKKKINRLKKMKEYRYFKCPKCKSELRVPRGKGNITVTCPKCHESFDKRS